MKRRLIAFVAAFAATVTLGSISPSSAADPVDPARVMCTGNFAPGEACYYGCHGNTCKQRFCGGNGPGDWIGTADCFMGPNHTCPPRRCPG